MSIGSIIKKINVLERDLLSLKFLLFTKQQQTAKKIKGIYPEDAIMQEVQKARKTLWDAKYVSKM